MAGGGIKAVLAIAAALTVEEGAPDGTLSTDLVKALAGALAPEAPL